MNRQLEKFLSAFGSMLDISPRPHKPIQAPPVGLGIERHFDAALGYIGTAMQYVEKAKINADNEQAHNGTR